MPQHQLAALADGDLLLQHVGPGDGGFDRGNDAVRRSDRPVPHRQAEDRQIFHRRRGRQDLPGPRPARHGQRCRGADDVRRRARVCHQRPWRSSRPFPASRAICPSKQFSWTSSPASAAPSWAQSEELAPADAKFYELRKETGTIPSLPLITGSVLSKKLAEGSEGLVIDVKWGNGSFIKDLEQAKQLARSMTRVGRSMKRRCVALVTDMNQPLGDTVGTALEVKEAIQLSQGRRSRGHEGARAQARHGNRAPRRRRRFDPLGQADRAATPHRRLGAREVQGPGQGAGRRHDVHRPPGKIPGGEGTSASCRPRSAAMCTPSTPP
jgi:hypothetical protein